MNKYGIIDKTTGKVKYSYEAYSMKGLAVTANEHHFEFDPLNGTYWYAEGAYGWDGSLTFDANYVPPELMPKFEFQAGPEGGLLIQETYGYSKDEYPDWPDYELEITASTTATLDVEITNEIRLYEGEYYFWETYRSLISETCELDFWLIDKNDVYQPGLFAILGLTPGVDELVLRPFVTNHSLKPEGHSFRPALGLMPVATGLYFRISVTNNSASTYKMRTYFQWYKQ